MKAQLYHLQINAGDVSRSLPFYKALFGYLEYRTVYDTDAILRVIAAGKRALGG